MSVAPGEQGVLGADAGTASLRPVLHVRLPVVPELEGLQFQDYLSLISFRAVRAFETVV